jgi:streptogrisin D
MRPAARASLVAIGLAAGLLLPLTPADARPAASGLPAVSSGPLAPVSISGGDTIYGGSARCVVGFNARSSSSYYAIITGRCGSAATTWYADPAHTKLVGTTAAVSFPGNDFALVLYAAGVLHPGDVNLFNGMHRDITAAGSAHVGQVVSKATAITGLHSGTVTAINATVTYPEGTVSGLIRTTICTEAGETGAPLISGTIGLGILSGGSGNCTSGGVSYYQPVTEVLSLYGLTLY